MRYRPFGSTGMAVSAVSLALEPAANMKSQDWRDLVFTALEQGINCFEVVNPTSAIIEGVGEGLRVIDRSLTFLALRLAVSDNGDSDFSYETMENTIRAFVARTDLGPLDLVMLDDPPANALLPPALAALIAMREEGVMKLLGIAGESPAVDGYISTGAFNVLSLPYSIRSGWITRGRLRAANEHGMVVIGSDFFPETFSGPPSELLPPSIKRGLFSAPVRRNPLAGAGTFAFMRETRGWTAEEICLAYALTEPAMATIQVSSEARDRLENLCAIVERDLPPGLISRIEMGRFSDVQAAKA